MIRAAGYTDLPAVRRLLDAEHLPLDGVDAHVETMVVANDGGEVVGAAAVEMYADGALLRSVVVSPRVQGQGLGHRLTEAALQVAKARGSRAIFLLTTTAENFFPKFGFERISRDEVPASVQASVEFTSACPASAIVMRKHLGELQTVLFACVHNAGRSQMAAAWFNHLADPAKARAISAGTNPGPRVHPEVVAAMREVGFDLANVSTTRLTSEVAQRAQMLVTLGCGDECPYVPGLSRDDWPLDDPKGKDLHEVRQIRDEIRDRVMVFIEQQGWTR